MIPERKRTQKDREITLAWRSHSIEHLSASVNRGMQMKRSMKALRATMSEQQAHRCCYCGIRSHELTIEHVIPVKLGGLDEPDNLVMACRDCNQDRAFEMWPEHIEALAAIGLLTEDEARQAMELIG